MQSTLSTETHRIILCLRQRHKLIVMAVCNVHLYLPKKAELMDKQSIKISIAVMFVDEGVISKTAEAALLLNNCRMRQQQDGGQKNRYSGRKEK